MYTFQYETSGPANDQVVIFFKMLCSRPLPWAAGTDFDPYFQDSNQIAIRIELSDDDDKDLYDDFIKWINGNIADEVTLLNAENAMGIWQSLSE
jgi:hypothetical protein